MNQPRGAEPDPWKRGLFVLVKENNNGHYQTENDRIRLSDPGRRGSFPSHVPHIPAMQVTYFSFPALYGRSLQRGEAGTLPDSMRADLIHYHGNQGVNPRKPKWNPCCTTSLEGGRIASVWRILIASRSRSETKKTDFCLIHSRHLELSHGMGKPYGLLTIEMLHYGRAESPLDCPATN